MSQSYLSNSSRRASSSDDPHRVKTKVQIRALAGEPRRTVWETVRRLVRGEHLLLIYYSPRMEKSLSSCCRTGSQKPSHSVCRDQSYLSRARHQCPAQHYDPRPAMDVLRPDGRLHRPSSTVTKRSTTGVTYRRHRSSLFAISALESLAHLNLPPSPSFPSTQPQANRTFVFIHANIR